MPKLIFTLLILFYSVPNSLFSQNLLDNEIEVIVNDLVKNLNDKNIGNVAVTDFTSLDGDVTQLGKYLAEEFSFALTNSRKSFSVIDRSKVNYLLEEKGLGAKGLLDPKSIAKLGKLKGINAIVTGNITPSENYIRVFIKVLDIESGTIVAASRGDISRTPKIYDLEGNAHTVRNSQTQGSVQTQKPSNRKLVDGKSTSSRTVVGSSSKQSTPKQSTHSSSPSKTSTSKTSTSNQKNVPVKQPTNQYTQVIKDFKFEFKHAKRTGKLITFEFDVTNLDAKDRSLILDNRRNKYFDNTKHEVTRAKVCISNNCNSGSFTRYRNSYGRTKGQVNKLMPSKIPLNIRVIFESDTASETNLIERVDITITHDSNEYVLQLYDVPIL